MTQPIRVTDLAPVLIEAETPFDAAAVEALVMGAFGPGRFAKTAERLREDSRPVVSLVAREPGRVVGAVRLWPIRIGDRAALFLGPIAVQADRRGGGLGKALVEAALQAAEERGDAGVLLVGDLPFFGRLGFEVAEGADMPGPVDPRRLLWRGLRSEPLAGPVRRA